ncbi:MAG: hypothetical protein IGQ45_06525 [Cyanobacterium sp. T60_A2020_053]|nr:hypothetical protein [Cyanobacterium sp. T60_A2020_053]
MKEKTAPLTPDYFISSSNKIHSNQCRHYKPDTTGWQKMESYSSALQTGATPCRICCPKNILDNEVNKPAEIEKVTSQEIEEKTETPSVIENQEKAETPPVIENEEKIETPSVIENEEKTEITSVVENEEKAETPSVVETEEKTETPSVIENGEKTETPLVIENGEKTETVETAEDKEKSAETKAKKKKKKKNKPVEKEEEKKRYKILAGNGCHQAIAEVKGILVPPADKNDSHHLILPDGCTLQATFISSQLKWLAFNQPNILGAHWFRGYPKMQDNKLVALQIIAWDLNMPTNEKGWETWEFIGLWTLQKNLTVQRSMGMKEIRTVAKETGFIKKFKYTFNNAEEWLKNKKLWSGYVYKLLCRREGDTLKIQKVIPYACPRIKPVPKDRNFDKNKSNSKFQPKSEEKLKPKSEEKSKPKPDEKLQPNS